MPRPLVSTKSWNVRGAAQVARVERDEAAAEAAAREHARHEQQALAEQRLRVLRAEAAARNGLDAAGAAALAAAQAQAQAAQSQAHVAARPSEDPAAGAGAARRKRPREGEGPEPGVVHRGEPRLVELAGPVPWYAGGAPRVARAGSGRSAEQDPLLAVQAYLRATEQALQRASSASRTVPTSSTRSEEDARSRRRERDKSHKRHKNKHHE
jgi:hypothetical protein